MSSPSTGTYSLQLDGLSIARGPREVVHDVSLDVPAGQVAAMLGPNGAGKSTIALAIAGMARITKGAITIEGESLVGKRPERVRAAGVSVVPEGRRLLSQLTVQDNLKVASYSLGKKAAGQA